ncbi:dynamin family protein, partial [Exiguobacterium sp. B2(2022)]|uniref:dynamin family protein n=1 Tax=Exiguobacterium sp. B2(2022) TaxID=2992755 RepID=UPI00237A4B21
MEKVEHYNRTLKAMSQSLQQMIQFAKLVGVESIVEEGHELLDRMMRSTFTLAVTGEVSAGKSTFLNGILKEQTLPTQMKETTALITKIKKGEREIL